MRKKGKNKAHFLTATLQSLVLGAITGAVTALFVTLYKFFASFAVHTSSGIFLFLKKVPFMIPFFLLFFVLLAFLLEKIYKKEPDLTGGGIPTSIGILRGFFSFSWWKNALGSFFLSLLSFLFGVPLGTEGPSVQLGTSLGAGVIALAPKTHRAWERFSMTGGASAGFAVATGAPISGIFFAIEEAHNRISPLIVLSTISSVLSALFTTSLISPLFGVEISLFPEQYLKALHLKNIWLPILLGLTLGLFALGFLRFYTFLERIILEKGKKIRPAVKIFIIFTLTLVLGLFSEEFVSTGHHLVSSLFSHSPALLFLILILVFRSALTLSANLTGITGGIFLPLMAIGATCAAILAKILFFFHLPEEFLSLIIALGICGCIAGMMKMPLTAVLFGVEALGLAANLLPLILVCTLSFVIPEALGEESIGERVLNKRTKKLRLHKTLREEEMEFTIEEGSFAEKKAVRDIFWPDGVIVLSAKKAGEGPLLSSGDTLFLKIRSFDFDRTLEELSFICKTEK